MATVTIDGIRVSVPDGSTINAAAQAGGIRVPALSRHPGQSITANCRICVCEVEGQRLLAAACAMPVWDGMVVKTRSPKVIEARKTILELILSRHTQDCLNCIRNGVCELQDLAAEYMIRDNPFTLKVKGYGKDRSTPSIVREQDKCINCRRCIGACSEIQTVHALGGEKRGYEAMVVPAMGGLLSVSTCVVCGQCILACPVGAI